MEYQPVMNIGMIGHVSDGKSTITKNLTGISTQKHSQEKQKNLTIRLGYANAKILKCNLCKEPECYFSLPSEKFDYLCPNCNSESILMNHVSFVDCPGHNMLLATMLNGTSVMNYTILVESSANQNFPAPQTIEHFNCVKSIGIKNVITVLNKIDLINKEKCIEMCEKLQIFLSDNSCESPIIPMSATHSINMDVLCMYIANLPKPEHNVNKNVTIPIIRSFNINKPGVSIENLQGGVVGGSIISGVIKEQMELYLVPGIIIKYDNKETIYKPIKCKVESINSEKNNLTQATIGGLIGIKLDIDPGLTADDKLIGNMLTDKITGIVSNKFECKLKENCLLDPKLQYVFNINSNNVNGKIISKKGDIIKINLNEYKYIDDGYIITISTFGSNIKLIGYAIFYKDLKYSSINSE